MVLRIFKMISTSGFLTALECTKFAPDFTEGAYRVPPDPLDGLIGHTSKEKDREKRKGERGRKKERKEWEGSPPFAILLDPPLAVFFLRDCRKHIRYSLNLPTEDGQTEWSG